MGLMTRSRRTLVLTILVALAGVLIVRQTGNTALEKAIDAYAAQGGSLTSYSPASVPAKRNMARWIGAGVQLIDMTMEERQFLKELTNNTGPLDNKNAQRLTELIHRNELAFQVLAKAITLTESSMGLPYSMHLEMPIPNLLEYLQASRLLGGKWRLEVQNGDLNAAITTAGVQQRIACTLSHEPVTIMGLISHVAENDFLEFIHETIPHMDEPAVKQHIEKLKLLKSMGAPIDRVIAVDGAQLYGSMTSEFIEQHFQQDFPAAERVWLQTCYRFNRPRFLANTLQTYIDLIHYSRKPATADAKNTYDESWISKLFFSSNFEVVVRRYQSQAAARELAIEALTLRLEALRAGRYIETPDLPTSVYSGETATFRRMPDGSAEVSFPQTAMLWGKKYGTSPEYKRRFTWKLPRI